jgi:uncharacterized repeat protein (TIGR02543 family)
MKKTIFISTLLLFTFFSWINPNALLPVQAATYSLTYELYGGTNHPMNPTSYDTESPNFTFNAPTKGNYEFLGWYASPNFEDSQAIDLFPGPWAGITRIYTRWGAPVYEVSFDTNGGSAASTQLARVTVEVASSGTGFTDNSRQFGNNTVTQQLSADFNNDGYGDFMLFVGAEKKMVQYTSTSTSSTIGFSSSETTLLYQNTVYETKYTDIDGDYIEDLLILYNFNHPTPPITWMRGLGNGTFAPEALISFDTPGVAVSSLGWFDVGDINQDGKVDMVFVTLTQAKLALGKGDGTFEAVQTINTTPTGSSFGSYIILEDMEFDGDLDIIFHTNNNIYLLKHNGSNTAPFYPTDALFIGAGGSKGYATDVDKNGIKDYIFKFDQGIGARGILRFPDDTFVPTYISSGNYQNIYLDTGLAYFWGFLSDFDVYDLNNDGILDAIYMSVSGYTRVFLSRPNGTYQVIEKLIGDYRTGGFIINRIDGTFSYIGYEETNKSIQTFSISTTNYLSSIGSLPSTTRDHYTFAGWYKDEALTQSVNFNSDILTANTILYAKWNLINYGINYSMNGGTNNNGNPTFMTIESSSFTLLNPIKAGSLFLGWYTTSNFQGEPITVLPAGATASINLFAKWLDPNTISFNSNGGSSVPNITTLPGNAVTVPTAPTRPGYTFDGWFVDRNFTQPYTFTTMPEASITLFAKWTALTFTVTFVTNGGNEIASISRDTDQSLSLPAAPTKTGNTFDGWYTNEALTNRLTATKMTPYNLTLYAKWITNVLTLTYTVNDDTITQQVLFGTTLSPLLPTPSKYQYEFLGWSLDGETLFTLPNTMPDNNLTLIALFRDNVNPVVFTLTDGDTYAGGVDIIFNEGTALLNGQPVQSGYRVQAAGTYTLVLTDDGGNVVEVTFTVIEAVDNSNLRWIIFASILTATWLFLALLYFFNRQPSSGGPGGTLVMNAPAPKPRPVIQTKKTVRPDQPVKKATIAKTEVKAIVQPQVVQPIPAVQEIKPTPQPKPVEVKKPAPKVEVKKPIDKAPPMPVVKSEEIDRQLTETVIFKNPLKVKVDPVESYTPELKQSFTDTFVSEKRAVKVPELTYVPQTTNVPFYTNLFRYIHRFAGVLTEGLLASLTQSVIKLTDDKEAQLKIVEASTRTAEGLKTNQNQDYLLKILRRNVALNRDVLNPRNKYVYSYQRLATLLEELGIYVEAVIVVREAYERVLVDTPDMTFEKRLARLEKKLVDSGGQRQDMIRK